MRSRPGLASLLVALLLHGCTPHPVQVSAEGATLASIPIPARSASGYHSTPFPAGVELVFRAPGKGPDEGVLLELYSDDADCAEAYRAHRRPKLALRRGATQGSWTFSDDGGHSWRLVYENPDAGVLFCPHARASRPEELPPAREVALDVLAGKLGMPTRWEHAKGCGERGLSIGASAPRELESVEGWVCQQPAIDDALALRFTEVILRRPSSLSEGSSELLCLRKLASQSAVTHGALRDRLGQPDSGSQATERAARVLGAIATSEDEAAAVRGLKVLSGSRIEVQGCRDRAALVSLLSNLAVARRAASAETRSALRTIASDEQTCGRYEQDFFSRRNALVALVMAGDSEGRALASALAAKCSDAQFRYHRPEFRLAAFGSSEDAGAPLACVARAGIAASGPKGR